MLERILLGDSPSIGMDPIVLSKTRETQPQPTADKIVKIMGASFASGAGGFVFYPSPPNLEALKLLKIRDEESSFDMYPLFPYAQDLVREATEKGSVGMIIERAKRLTLSGRVGPLFRGGLGALTMNPRKMFLALLDAEIAGTLDVAPHRANLGGIFLHDLVVDLSIAFGLREILETYISHVSDIYKVKPGLVTRNFSRLIRFLESSNISTKDILIMTAFNPLGLQMNPSREACEETLASRDYLDVVAVSVLSAGLFDLETVLGYIKRVKNLRSVVLGVSSEEQARTTFSALSGLNKLTSTVFSSG